MTDFDCGVKSIRFRDLQLFLINFRNNFLILNQVLLIFKCASGQAFLEQNPSYSSKFCEIARTLLCHRAILAQENYKILI